MKREHAKRLLAAALAAASLQSMTVLASAETADAVSQIPLDEGLNVCEPVKDAGDAGDHIHGSAIVKFPDGEMMCAWFQGNGERDATTTRIMAARMPAGESEWGEPFVLADTPRMADINPVLYVDHENTLWLFWYPVLGGRWETSQPKYLKAEEGHYESANGFDEVPDWTWQDAIYVKVGGNFSGLDDSHECDKVDPENDPYTLWLEDQYAEFRDYTFAPLAEGGAGMLEALFGADFDEFVEERLALSRGELFYSKKYVPYARRWGWQTKDKPLEIEWEGHTRMLLPLYSDTMECAIVAYTDDGGETWEFSYPMIGQPVIQASMLQREDGTLVAYLRDNGEIPQRIAVSESTDGGETWTIAKDHQGLFDPGVGSDITELPNGNWVFVHNDNQDSRASLTVALSEDQGETWTYRRHIALDTRSDARRFHYPEIIADEDGTIYVSYTVDYSSQDGELAGYNHIKYVVIDEDWIKAGDGENLGERIYSYELAAHAVTTNLTDADFVDGKLVEGWQEKVELPQTVKGYWTYTEKLEDGLNTYVELPILWTDEMLAKVQAAIEEGKYNEELRIEGIGIDMDNLPEGVTAEMLPEFKFRMKLVLVENEDVIEEPEEPVAPVEEEMGVTEQ